MLCWSTQGSWGWFELLTRKVPRHFWSVPPEPHWVRALYEICCLPSYHPRCKSGVFSVPGTSTLSEGSAGFCLVRNRHGQHAFPGTHHLSALLIPRLTSSPGEHLAMSGDTFGCQKRTNGLVSSVPMPRMSLNILGCSRWLPSPFPHLKKRVTHSKISVVLRLKNSASKLCEMITQHW